MTDESDSLDFEGIITFYNETGEYGFISSASVKEDVFFLEEDLTLDFVIEDGIEVSFDYINRPKGPKATEVEAVEATEETEENSAEDNTDSNDTMYDFMSNGDDSTDDEQTATEEEEESYEVRMWSLGNHSTLDESRSESMSNTLEQFMSDMDSDVDGEVMGILQEAQSMVDTTTLRSFECPVDECGLQHSHSDTKHDIRSAFNVEDDFADGLMFNPYCHCSVNELAMLMRFFSYINTPVFTDQADFEGVLEIEPTELNALFRSYIEDRQRTVDMAVQEVAKERGLREEQVAPQDVREDLLQFFQRRQDIQNAANHAPIPQETRRKINDAEDELERMTNQ